MIVRLKFLKHESFLLKKNEAAKFQTFVKKYGYQFIWLGQDNRDKYTAIYVDQGVFQALGAEQGIIHLFKQITLEEALSKIEIL